MEFNVLSPAEAVFWAGQVIMSSGLPQSSRGMETREIQNVTFHVRFPHLDPLDAPGRNANPTIGALEACQLVGQTSSPEGVIRRVGAFKPYSDEGIFWGAYGPRVASQLARAAYLLKTDHGTRQAVVSIYDGQRDLLAGARDIPCTLALQFLWEPEDRLLLRTSMRSNDVFLGLPYDLFQFTSLQCAMADSLHVRPGGYIHTVGSMHMYLKDHGRVEAVRNPGEPTADEARYTIRWRGESIGDISRRARDILNGVPIEEPTEYEKKLVRDLEAK